MGFEEIKTALKYNITNLESACEKLKSGDEVDLRDYVLSSIESQIDLNKAILELFSKFEGVLNRADKIGKAMDSIKDKAKKKKRVMGNIYS